MMGTTRCQGAAVKLKFIITGPSSRSIAAVWAVKPSIDASRVYLPAAVRLGSVESAAKVIEEAPEA